MLVQVHIHNGSLPSISGIPVIGHTPSVSQISHDRVALDQGEHIASSFIDLLHQGNLPSGTDLGEFLRPGSALEHANLSMLVLNVVLAAEGYQGSRRLTDQISD